MKWDFLISFLKRTIFVKSGQNKKSRRYGTDGKGVMKKNILLLVCSNYKKINLENPYLKLFIILEHLFRNQLFC